MLDLSSVDLEDVSNALADQTDYEHRWLINPQSGEIAFWTADTGIDGQTPVDLDELDLVCIDPLPSCVWYQDMADFAEAITDERAGRRLARAIQGSGAFRRWCRYWRARLPSGTMRQMTDRAMVRRWLVAYEAAWRTPGTQGLAEIFTADASYRQSPYQEPVAGLDAISRMWDDEREGPDEIFTIANDILAVDGPTAVVRVEVRYGDPLRQEYRDLWIMELAVDGRCRWFEEWPFWPGQPRAADD